MTSEPILQSFVVLRAGSFVTGFIQNEQKLSSLRSFSSWHMNSLLVQPLYISVQRILKTKNYTTLLSFLRQTVFKEWKWISVIVFTPVCSSTVSKKSWFMILRFKDFLLLTTSRGRCSAAESWTSICFKRVNPCFEKHNCTIVWGEILKE